MDSEKFDHNLSTFRIHKSIGAKIYFESFSANWKAVDLQWHMRRLDIVCNTLHTPDKFSQRFVSFNLTSKLINHFSNFFLRFPNYSIVLWTILSFFGCHFYSFIFVSQKFGSNFLSDFLASAVSCCIQRSISKV